MLVKETVEVDKIEVKVDKKPEKSNRESFLKQARDLGIQTKGLSDDQLLSKVIGELNIANSKLAASMATNELKGLGKYQSGIKHSIKDEEFVRRLMNLNIPNFYLDLFSDDDSTKTDKELWKIVNKSGRSVFKSLKDLMISTQTIKR